MRIPASLIVASAFLTISACGESDSPGRDVELDTNGSETYEDIAEDAQDSAEPDSEADAEEVDAEPDADAEIEDLGSDSETDEIQDLSDSTEDAADASDGEAELSEIDEDSESTDAGLPLEGFGSISGACGVLDDELTSPNGFVFVNSIDFGDDPFDDPADLSFLTEGGRILLAAGNAGGSSLESELFSLEILSRCEGASLLKTETEIEYDVAGKITDILLEIDGMRVGVSVTRAVGFPRDAEYTTDAAATLLERKLTDILESSENVSAEDAWVKQILHVLAYADQHVEAMQAGFESLSPEIRADTILWISRTDGDDEFIY